MRCCFEPDPGVGDTSADPQHQRDPAAEGAFGNPERGKQYGPRGKDAPAPVASAPDFRQSYGNDGGSQDSGESQPG